MTLEPFRGNKLPAFEFARLAFDIADQLTGEQVFLRRAPGLKAFVEEVLPIATFAKSWEKPERHVTVQYFGGNHPYDAAVTLHGGAIDAGFFEPLYHLEVTSAAFEREHLEREALARYGSVFGDPNIHRVGSRRRGDDQIVSQATAQDGDTPATNLQSWVIRAITAKSDRNYPAPSILVVRAEPSRPLALTEWCSVVAAANPAARASQFEAVVLVDWFNASVHHL